MHPTSERLWMVTCGATDIGLVRSNNEDGFQIADLESGRQGASLEIVSRAIAENGLLLAVSDGMGGHQAGEVASAITLDSIREHLQDRGERTPRAALADAVVTANEKVRTTAREFSLRGMGATLAAVLIENGTAYIANVGDSRVYLLRNGKFRQLTRDQTLAHRLFDLGMLTPREAEVSSHRNVLLQAIGPAERVEPEFLNMPLLTGDILLLCSDGLWSLVPDWEIKFVIETCASLPEAVERLISLARAHGGSDNITVLVGEVSRAATGAAPSPSVAVSREFALVVS